MKFRRGDLQVSRFDFFPQPRPRFCKLIYVFFVWNNYELAWTAREVHSVCGLPACLRRDDRHPSKAVDRSGLSRDAENCILASTRSSAPLRLVGALATEPDFLTIFNEDSSP